MEISTVRITGVSIFEKILKTKSSKTLDPNKFYLDILSTYNQVMGDSMKKAISNQKRTIQRIQHRGIINQEEIQVVDFGQLDQLIWNHKYNFHHQNV